MAELDREKLLEVMARAIAPRCWEVMDAELNRMLQKYKGQKVAYPSDQFQHKESMATARKALLALEAAGVRLVPEEATGEMKAALMAKSPLNAMRCKLAWDYMLAASPYAKEDNSGT